MVQFFEDHGADADVKAPRPENKKEGSVQAKTKLDAPRDFHHIENNQGHSQNHRG